MLLLNWRPEVYLLSHAVSVFSLAPPAPVKYVLETPYTAAYAKVHLHRLSPSLLQYLDWCIWSRASIRLGSRYAFITSPRPQNWSN